MLLSLAVSSRVDVERALDQLATSNPEKLDWRHSVVDLLTPRTPR